MASPAAEAAAHLAAVRPAAEAAAEAAPPGKATQLGLRAQFLSARQMRIKMLLFYLWQLLKIFAMKEFAN